jgi:hypothetical protein
MGKLSEGERTELESLRQRYNQNSAELPRRGQFYQVRGAERELIGAIFACHCGRQWRLGIDRAFTERTCFCGAKFDLLEEIGYSRLFHAPADIARLMGRLPEHRSSRPAQTSPHIDTWGGSNDGDVGYEMYDPSARR